MQTTASASCKLIYKYLITLRSACEWRDMKQRFHQTFVVDQSSHRFALLKVALLLSDVNVYVIGRKEKPDSQSMWSFLVGG